MNCPRCGASTPDRARFCAHCGAQLSGSGVRRRQRSWLWMAVAISTVVIAVAVGIILVEAGRPLAVPSSPPPASPFQTAFPTAVEPSPTVSASSTPTKTPLPSLTPSPSPTPLSQLKGRVVDEKTGIPLIGVQISADERTTTTDADGRFLVSDLPEGQYSVLLTADDHDPVLSGIIVVSPGGQTAVDVALPVAGSGTYPRDPMASHQIDPAGAANAQDAERLARLQGFQGEVVSAEEVILTGEYLVNYKAEDTIRAALAELHHPAWGLVDETGHSWYIVQICGNLALAKPASIEAPPEVIAQPHPVVTVNEQALTAHACPSPACSAVAEIPVGWNGLALACSQACTWVQVQGPGISGECWVQEDGLVAMGSLAWLPEIAWEGEKGSLSTLIGTESPVGWISTP